MGPAARVATCSAARRASDERFGTLADGTPYDLVFVFDDIGYNFEPSEIGAAYGLVQLDKLAGVQRAPPGTNSTRLDDFFADHEDTVMRPRTTDRAPTRRGCASRSSSRDGVDRTAVQEFLASGASRPAWCGPATSCASRASPGSPTGRLPAGCPNADRVMDRALSLPIHHGLTSDAVGHIAESLSECLHALAG